MVAVVDRTRGPASSEADERSSETNIAQLSLWLDRGSAELGAPTALAIGPQLVTAACQLLRHVRRLGYSSLGAESLHPIAPCTTVLTYGVIDKNGQVPVRLIYDHRVMDGATVARVLNHLDAEMNGSI